MKTYKFVMPILFISLFVACGDKWSRSSVAPRAVTGIEAPAPDTPGVPYAPVAGLDMKTLKKHGQETLAKILGAAVIVEDVYYVDGVSGVDMPTVNDHSALYVRGRVPAHVAPLSGLRVAYRAGLNGSEGLFFVRETESDPIGEVYPLNRGIAVFKSDISFTEAKAYVDGLRMRYSRANFEFLESVLVLIFSAEPAQFSEIYRFLDKATPMKSVELDRETFQVPFHFEAARRVDKDHVDDLDALRGFSAPLCRATLTSLPPPFGGGRQENPSCGRIH